MSETAAIGPGLIIHNFSRGARGLRVVWLCEEMGLPYHSSKVDFPPGPDYLAMHAPGSVPFLEDADGVAMAESVAMLLYLVQRYGPTPLLPGPDQPATLARVMELCVFSEASLGAQINSLLEEKFAAPAADKNNWSVRAMRRRLATSLAFLEQRLGEGPYLAGKAFSLADIAVAPGLGMYRGALDGEIPESLSEYLARIAARPAYQRAQATQGARPGS